MELRHRRGGGDDDTEEQQVVRTFRPMRAIRSLDMFPKAKEDYRRKQNALGGAVSTFTISFIALLILVDLAAYVFGWNAYRTELSVDRGLSASVPFDLDITFFRVPCHELSLDAVDASGKELPDIDHELTKTPVDHSERLVNDGAHRMVDRRWMNHNTAPAGGGPAAPVRSTGGAEIHAHPNFRDGHYCGPCFAPPPESLILSNPKLHERYSTMSRHFEEERDSNQQRRCCNSCDDVMHAYDQHKFPRPEKTWVEQCVLEMSKQHPGCNVRGVIYLRKVQGAFFFAPGHGAHFGGRNSGAHVHMFTINELLSFNSSHEIRRFRIGDPNIERVASIWNPVKFPLEGRRFVTPNMAQATVKYRLQIVPTAYRTGSGDGGGSAGSSSSSASSASFSAAAAGGAVASETEADESEVTYEYQASAWSKMSMPGIFALFGGGTPSVLFKYDFNAMQLTHVYDRPSFSVFLVRACSIIGGLFVILGLLDRLVQYLAKEVEWERLLGPQVALTVQRWLQSEMMG